MIFVRYVASAIAAVFLNFFMWLTCWFWAIIPALFNLKNLPGPLWYLQTHDDDAYGSGMTGEPIPSSIWKRWLRATWWLARNPAYAFDTYVLGIRPPNKVVIVYGDKKDASDGFYYRIEPRGFGYRRNWYWGKRFYWKVWVGWHYSAKDDSGILMLKSSFGPKWE